MKDYLKIIKSQYIVVRLKKEIKFILGAIKESFKKVWKDGFCF